MRPISYKVFRYAGRGLDEISIKVLFPFKLLKPGIFWLLGHKVSSANYSRTTGSFVTKIDEHIDNKTDTIMSLVPVMTS